MSKSEETVPLADPEHSTLGTVIVLGMMGLLTLLAAAFVAFSVWWATEHASRIATWPSTTGTVLSSRVDAQRSQGSGSGGSSVKYDPLVERSYTVDGVDYTFDRVTPMKNVSRGSRWANDIAREYSEGDEVEVFYNPDNPGESFIEPVYDDMMFIIAMFACAVPGVLALFTTLGGKDKYAIKWKVPVIACFVVAIGGGIGSWSYFSTVPQSQWTGRAQIAGVVIVGGALLLALTGAVFRAKHMRWRRLNA